ncbi:MAG TPA: branched-chain amino acid ABC transporter permease, partial [Stellaceae bacterium]|nr:branched-chain amino acid ABC transporter permease [Stellaceae bacterium]
MLNQRAIIVGSLTLGQATLLLIAAGAGLMAARAERLDEGLFAGMFAGAVASLPLSALTAVIAVVPLRAIFIALSPDLFLMLSSGQGVAEGVLIFIGGGAAAGLLGAGLRRSPALPRRAAIAGLAAIAVAGVFQELIQAILQQYEGIIGEIRDFLYTWEGLTPQGAAVCFASAALGGGITIFFAQRRAAQGLLPDRRRQRLIGAGVGLLALALLPAVAGSYIGQVLMLVGLYILMGMGLNLEIGLAGLLDLGFVAFFAVGAYTTALLTADSPHALAHLSYWAAMPISVVLAVIIGVLFGLPVLGVRGDYLAVATLGLGEIVSVIVMSDFAAPLLGGAQGILQIPKPVLGRFTLGSPVSLFYLTLVCSGVAAFVAWRLENSRLGRAWMALRDDEDVAQALGINLVRS